MSIPISWLLMKPTDQDPLFFKKKLLNLESVMYTVCLRSKDELSIWDKDLGGGELEGNFGTGVWPSFSKPTTIIRLRKRYLFIYLTEQNVYIFIYCWERSGSVVECLT